jgi:hypothetical protein
MTLDQLGNLGDFIAAIATLATLAYLASQIRQRTRSPRASAFQGFTEPIIYDDRLVASDPELARLVGLLSATRLEDLERVERVRLGHLLLSGVRRNEALFLQRGEGVAAEEAWRGQARGGFPGSS